MAAARKFAHSSRPHGDAMTILFKIYREECPAYRDGTFISLDALWDFCNKEAD
tara:strand:+ start:101 stop:259 length:159 start_codon:yes stop_codon:yes gene_type:complete